jgi:regulator of nonsense transcripts 2
VLSTQENLGPSEEAEAEFAKELAKMVTDSSTESRKVDKKTALALWDSAVLPPGIRKKRGEENSDERTTTEQDGQDLGQDIMNFTVITKRGNKQNVRLLCYIWPSLTRTLSRLVKLPFPLHLP